MSGRQVAVMRSIGQLFQAGPVAGLDDRALLERFAGRRDEAAFAALVALHGPMVLGVCRRIVRDEHDVEDAFQATFLVLVRRAGSIRDPGRLGPWLHGVAPGGHAGTGRGGAAAGASGAVRSVGSRGGACRETHIAGRRGRRAGRHR